MPTRQVRRAILRQNRYWFYVARNKRSPFTVYRCPPRGVSLAECQDAMKRAEKGKRSPLQILRAARGVGQIRRAA